MLAEYLGNVHSSQDQGQPEKKRGKNESKCLCFHQRKNMYRVFYIFPPGHFILGRDESMEHSYITKPKRRYTLLILSRLYFFKLSQEELYYALPIVDYNVNFLWITEHIYQGTAVQQTSELLLALSHI